MIKGLLDVFSIGTEGIHQADPRQSLVPIPINEDWCMVGVVVAVSPSDSVILWTKIWDETTQFQASLRYWGHPGTPPTSAVKVGQQLVFHRVSEGEFVCFVPYPSILLVQDLGEGQGREIYYDDTWAVVVPPDSETLTLKTVEPLARFHSSTPAFTAGRVYPGRKHYSAAGVALYYLVFLAGFGDDDFFFDVVIDGTTVRLTVDFSGKLKNFEII